MSLTEISNYIALILRHNPEAIEITLDEHGWANVDELIAGISKEHDFNMEMTKDGYEFFLSANKVWLTKSVPVKYLEKI